MAELPLFRLDVSDTEDSGVAFVALVDEPAVEINWMAFNKSIPFDFKITNEDKRVISGVLMVADKKIYRNDSNGEYFVEFTKDAINNVVKKFFKDGNTASVNLMHNPQQITDGVYMFESFIIDSTRMSVPKGFEGLTDGSWFGSYQVENDAVWQDIKDGKFKGFSIEGNFTPMAVKQRKDEDILKQILEIINS